MEHVWATHAYIPMNLVNTAQEFYLADSNRYPRQRILLYLQSTINRLYTSLFSFYFLSIKNGG